MHIRTSHTMINAYSYSYRLGNRSTTFPSKMNCDKPIMQKSIVGRLHSLDWTTGLNFFLFWTSLCVFCANLLKLRIFKNLLVQSHRMITMILIAELLTVVLTVMHLY